MESKRFPRGAAIRLDHGDEGGGVAQGHYAEAEPVYKRSLAIRQRALGPEHPHVATSLENYAALLRGTARADEARHPSETSSIPSETSKNRN